MYFPTYYVDDFFKNPENIKNYGLSLNYIYDEENYPGGRSKPLHLINPSLATYVQNKIITLIYGPEVLREDDLLKWIAGSYFQLIRPKDVQTKEGKNINEGWIHTDPNTALTSIVYLTDHELTGGTSIYKVKNKEYIDKEFIKEATKFSRSFNKTGETDENKYKDFMHETESSYKKISSFNNEFNSLLAFDGGNPHKADLNIKEGTYRLTLITFFYTVYATLSSNYRTKENDMNDSRVFRPFGPCLLKGKLEPGVVKILR